MTSEDGTLHDKTLDDMTLDDDVRAYLTLQAQVTAGLPPLWERPLDQVRSEWARTALRDAQAPTCEVRDLTLSGPAGALHARLYRPAGASGTLPLVVYLHGGGFVLGDLDTHDAAVRRGCTGTGVAWLSVAYRLAPEHRYPAAVDDAEAVVRWAASHAADLNADGERLIVAGDSAGATLATVVARRLRDAGGPDLAGQLLFYPATDLRPERESASMAAYGEGFGLTRASMRWFGEEYLPDEAAAAQPDASPALAEDLSGLPPAFVLTAAYDPLVDEGDAYARRLAEEGVSVEHHRLPGTIHGIVAHPVLLRSGETAWRLANDWLRRRMGTEATV
ncbi:MAG: alpha/beta hydrolase [Trueperaceae bacterium]